MQDKKNSYWLALQYILSVVIAFTVIKINITYFGEQLFGMWLIFFSVWALGNALDLGFGTTIVKFIAEADNKNDENEISLIISSGLIFYCILGLLIYFICIMIINVFLLHNINIVPVKFNSIALKLYPILGINFYLQYLAYSFRSIFEGMRDFILSSKIILFYNFLNLFVVVLISLFGLSIVDLAIGLVMSSAIYLFISYFLLKKYHHNINVKFSFIRKTTIKKILKFSIHIQIASIFNSLIDPIVKYIIGNSYDLSLVAIYEIGKKVTTSVSGLFFATFKTLLPRTSILKNHEESFRFFNTQVAKISQLGIVYSGVMFGILSIFIMGIIKLFFVSNTILLVIIILALPETINNFGYSIYIFLLGIGKASFLSFLQFINLILTILGLVIGFHLFHNSIGLLGYFISVFIGNILMLVLIKKLFKSNLKEFLKNVKIYKLIFLLTIILISVILLNNEEGSSFLIFLIMSIVSFILFFNDLKILYKEISNITKN
jgi:O-antigen/teichoic acid export membrane protein